MSRECSEDEDEGGAEADLEAALSAVLNGFVARDEHVELAPAPGLGAPNAAPRRAHLAGVDGDGRAILVLLAEGEEAVLAAIDALVWSSAHSELLTRRLGSTPDLAPCVVLVAPRFEARIVTALETLRVAGVRGIVWRRGGASLWTLRARGDRLEAEVQGARMPIEGPDDVERVLERALRTLLELPEERGGRPAPRPRRTTSSLMPSGPLLSEAELAALRGP